jgi:hypothetical protein
LHRTDMAAAPPHAGLDHAGGGFGSKLFFCVCEFLHVSDRSHPETATTAEPQRRTARAPGPAHEMRAATPAFLRVARHDHGTALGGFLPRAWDHLVASDGTTRRVARWGVITPVVRYLQVVRRGGSADGVPGGLGG